MVRCTLEYFKWLDATGSKPPQGCRVLLKILGEDNPVVGWYDGDWHVCTANLCAFYESFEHGILTAEIEPEFYNSEVTAYMHIDMTLPFNELGEDV